MGENLGMLSPNPQGQFHCQSASPPKTVSTDPENTQDTCSTSECRSVFAFFYIALPIQDGPGHHRNKLGAQQWQQC